jgi:hypothetical protein
MKGRSLDRPFFVDAFSDEPQSGVRPRSVNRTENRGRTFGAKINLWNILPNATFPYLAPMEDQFEKIVDALKDKACLKQQIYRATLAVFSRMKQIAEELAQQFQQRFDTIDKNVLIEYSDENEFEFYLKFSGDLLMFSMHSNVLTFGDEHILSKSPYVQENYHRGYYGTIVCYNFMADSLKYGRMNDAGYLLARMLLNFEGHYYIEGVRQLNFLHPDIAVNVIDDHILREFLQSCMHTAIDNDLYAPAYHEIQFVALGDKLQNSMTGAEKVGFKMKTGNS